MKTLRIIIKIISLPFLMVLSIIAHAIFSAGTAFLCLIQMLFDYCVWLEYFRAIVLPFKKFIDTNIR